MNHRFFPSGITIKALQGIGLAAAIAIAAASGCTTAPATTGSGTGGTAPATTGGVSGVEAGAGSLLVNGTTTPFHLRGFSSIGLLYPAQYAATMCMNLGSATQNELASAETTMTTHTATQLNAMIDDWNVNAVRFQVSQGALQYEHENNLSGYTDMVAAVISEARTLHLVVVVSMQTQAYSCTLLRSDGQLQRLPDQLTEEAWAQLIPALPSDDRSIILEVFNEPDTPVECAATAGSSTAWTDWATGCATGTDEGNETVGTYVRSLAPDNVLMFDADNGGGTFANFTPPSGMPSNTVYSVHPYYYYLPGSGSTTPLEASTANWDMRFGDLQAAGNTVVVTEWNESSGCSYTQDPTQTIATDLVDTYLPAHNAGLMLFSWDAPGGGVLVNPSTFAPVDSNSSCSYFTGATLGYNYFESISGGN